MEKITIAHSHQAAMNDSNSSLSIADKNRCNQVYENYKEHITHVQGLLHSIQQQHYAFIRKLNKEHEAFSLKKVDSVIDELKEAIENLTRSLIVKIENYFKKRYCLFFDSLLLKDDKASAQPLSSYSPIINNIAEQFGNDFLKAGKDQIKSRFLGCFHKDRLPLLKANRITIPDLLSIDDHYGERTSLSSHYNSAIEYLIDALNLFFNDNTEQPEGIAETILEWKDALDLAEYYQVFPDASFKFFKNRRIDILFSSATIARRFWNYYKLEVIDKIIDKNK